MPRLFFSIFTTKHILSQILLAVQVGIVHRVVSRHSVLALPNLHLRVRVHRADQALELSVLQVLGGRAVEYGELGVLAVLAERAVRHQVCGSSIGGGGSGGASAGGLVGAALVGL